MSEFEITNSQAQAEVKRTILGLSAELHALQLQLEEVRKQILALSKEEDIDAEAW